MFKKFIAAALVWLCLSLGGVQAAAPAIDQSGVAGCAGCGGTTTGPAITISTTGNNELVILLYQGNRSSTSGAAMSWTPSGCGVTWALRATGVYYTGGEPSAVQEWWGAVTGGALSSCTVTSTASASEDAGTVIQFSLTGVASLTSPFDANTGGSPLISGGNNASLSEMVTTSQSAYIFGVSGSAANNNGSFAALTSTTAIGSITDGSHSQNGHITAYGGSFTGFQSRIICCTTGNNSNGNAGYLIDAIAGSGGSGSTTFPPDSHVDLDQTSSAGCGNCGGATKGPSIAVNTTNANELVLLLISGNSNTTSGPMTWTPTGCGLTWTLRGTGLWTDSNSHPAAGQLFWAWASSQLQACIVTTTAGVAQDAGAIIQLSLAGVGSSVAPFDTNGSLPAVSSVNSNPPDTTISTNKQAFLLSLITNNGNCICGSTTNISGTAEIGTNGSSFNQNNTIASWGGTYTSPQTSLSCCTTGNSGFSNQGYVIDAIAGSGGTTTHSHIIIGKREPVLPKLPEPSLIARMKNERSWRQFTLNEGR